MMFFVSIVKTNIEVEVLGLKRTADLCFADGMIGAMPVFDKLEDALSWAGDINLILEIKPTDNKGE